MVPRVDRPQPARLEPLDHPSPNQLRNRPMLGIFAEFRDGTCPAEGDHGQAPQLASRYVLRLPDRG